MRSPIILTMEPVSTRAQNVSPNMSIGIKGLLSNYFISVQVVWLKSFTNSSHLAHSSEVNFGTRDSAHLLVSGLGKCFPTYTDTLKLVHLPFCNQSIEWLWGGRTHRSDVQLYRNSNRQRSNIFEVEGQFLKHFPWLNSLRYLAWGQEVERFRAFVACFFPREGLMRDRELISFCYNEV